MFSLKFALGFLPHLIPALATRDKDEASQPETTLGLSSHLRRDIGIDEGRILRGDRHGIIRRDRLYR